MARTADFEQITGLSVVKTLTIPTGAYEAIIQAEAQNVRYRYDETDPTASIGQQIFVGHPPVVLAIFEAENARFLEEVAGAKLNVHYNIKN